MKALLLYRHSGGVLKKRIFSYPPPGQPKRIETKYRIVNILQAKKKFFSGPFHRQTVQTFFISLFLLQNSPRPRSLIPLPSVFRCL
jgi:hypothetical protein